ncbi:transposase [Streptomyces sp. NPDC057908]|uniref:transposase n=1 Tax=Streptomyces sp. NPDC057908 TaxID=3346276 RepID=UPI0036EF0B7D
MRVDLSRRLVPDELWELTSPLLPRFKSRPQGGGTAPVDERAVFAAVVYVLTSGCAAVLDELGIRGRAPSFSRSARCSRSGSDTPTRP